MKKKKLVKFAFVQNKLEISFLLAKVMQRMFLIWFIAIFGVCTEFLICVVLIIFLVLLMILVGPLGYTGCKIEVKQASF